MKANQILISEHRLIERVLAALETGAWLLAQDPTFKPQFFFTAADFIVGFADGCHHAKEEGILFKAMVENGMVQNGNPVAAMLHEHELGRSYTRGMRAAAERLMAGDQAARAEVVQYARRYAALLRNHIGAEDQIVFPMAAELIPPEQQAMVWRLFEQAENDSGADMHATYEAMVNSLEEEIEVFAV